MHDSVHLCNVLDSKGFKKSLPHLRGAIALSDYLAEWLRTELDVPVASIKHPTELTSTKFTWNAFTANHDKKLVQVGFFLRNYRAIYQVDPPEEYQKVYVAEDRQSIIEARKRVDTYSPYRRRPDIGEVQVVSWLEHAEYDQMFSRNVIFMELFDASANNAIVEAIVRETPVVVNRHPAVVEYLGREYPLFYDDISEVRRLLELTNVRRAHEYLRAMDKSDLTIEHFVTSINDFISKVT